MGETIWGLTAAIRPLACRGEQKFKRRPSVLPTARLAIPRLSVATDVAGDSTPRGNARKLFLSSSSLCSSAATDLPGFGPGLPVPTPRKSRLEENACSVWTRRVSRAGSCSSSLITPLPAWTRGGHGQDRGYDLEGFESASNIRNEDTGDLAVLVQNSGYLSDFLRREYSRPKRECCLF